MYQRVGAPAYKPGLQTTLDLLESLGNPHHSFRSIHVAGTNGKGSSAHMLASVLASSGIKTGLYTSPHLKDFRERIRINGSPVSEQYVVAFVDRVKPLLNRLSPSFFEWTVAMAFCYFKEMGVEWAVVEVGMGGRLDSTNVINPELCLITQIGYDHMEFLGNTLPEIASEKAGIIKHKVPIVVSETHPETKAVFEAKAAQENAPLTFADQKVQVEQVGLQKGIRALNLCDAEGTHRIELDLLGNYQLKNIKGVWACLRLLQQQGCPLQENQIQFGLRNVSSLTGLKGRWQQLKESPTVVCDTAHNASGVADVLAQMKSYSYDKLHIVWGMVADKDRSSILSQLPKDALYYFSSLSVPRGLHADALREEASRYGLVGASYSAVNEALDAALLAASARDFILIGGSTFLVADLRML